MGIIIFIVVGFIAGLIARALVPGDDSMGFIGTTILGIVGSFVGGAIAAIFNDGKILDFNTTGLILSIVGAVVALLVYRQVASKR